MVFLPLNSAVIAQACLSPRFSQGRLSSKSTKSSSSPLYSSHSSSSLEVNNLLQVSHISEKNKYIYTKLSGSDPWGLHRTSIMSWKTLSSMSLVRKLQRPPSAPLPAPPFLRHFLSRYQHKIVRIISRGQIKSYMTLRMNLPSMSPVMDP